LGDICISLKWGGLAFVTELRKDFRNDLSNVIQGEDGGRCETKR
jgi:hypothetical protein